jgi:hypothetical protein
MKKGTSQNILCDTCRKIITNTDYITIYGKKRILHYCNNENYRKFLINIKIFLQHQIPTDKFCKKSKQFAAILYAVGILKISLSLTIGRLLLPPINNIKLSNYDEV